MGSAATAHASAIGGRPRQNRPQARPILRKCKVDYKSTCLKARLVFRNVSEENLDWVKCQITSLDGVTSVAKERHVLIVRAEGGPVTANGIKTAVWHMLDDLS